MALSRDVVIRLIGDADSAVKAQKAAADAAGVSVAAYRKAEREFDRQAKAMETASRRQRDAMDKVGRGAVAFGAGVAAALGLSVKAAVDWETAWTGVAKTVSGTPAQMAAIEQGLRGLARVLPATHTEIAAVAEAAGQLGVQTDSIVEFTRTMIDLGETTNLTAEDAATSIAQLMNIMQTAPEDVGRLGAALVELGNNGASTEADILNMAQRLAGAGALVGATEADVLALANAMASMGIQSELGGGAMTRVLQKIYTAVQDGGEALSGFADVAGMSAEQFASAFQEDPIAAVDAFVQGLNRVDESGGNVVGTLSDLGIEGTQERTVLLSMKSAGDLLTQSLDDGSRAWEENTALVEEAAKRYDTTASKLEIARNNINEAGIEIGQTLLPALADLAEGVADVAAWFADLPDPIKNVLSALAGVAGVASLAGGAFLLLFPRVVDTRRAFRDLAATSPRLAANLGRVGKAAGIAAVFYALTNAVDGLMSSMDKAPPGMEATTQALLNLGTGAQASRSAIEQGILPLEGYRVAAERLTDPNFIQGIDDFSGKITGLFGIENHGQRQQFVDQINRAGESLALMVQSGNAELAADQFDLLAEQWERGGGNVDELMDLMPAYSEALKGVENEQQVAAETAATQAEATARLRENLDVSLGSLEGYAAALGLDEDATQELIDKSNELGESLADFVPLLGTYQGLLDEKKAADEEAARATAAATESQSDSWEDYVHDVHVTFEEYEAALEDQVKAQQDWQLNMLLLAGRVSQGTLDELAAMGPEGAALVADLVDRSDAELDHMDDLFAARSKEATDAWGEELTLAQPVLAAIAAKAGKGAADAAARELAAGTKTIADIARQYGIELAGGVNPLLTALGERAVTLRSRGGGISNADGNLFEAHQAEIAPGGAWRVWAEPETGGEAYIPLASSKRGRSLDIWRETGRRLNAFADGGFFGVDDVPRPPSTDPFGPPISTAADATMNKAYKAAVAWIEKNIGTLLGGTFGPSRPSPRGVGGLGPVAAAAREFVMRTFGISNIGGYSYRNIAGTGVLSDHALGKAIDVMIANYRTPAGIAKGNSVASWFVTHPAAFGTKYVIWRDQINSGSGWQPYGHPGGGRSDTLQHRDHVHVSFYKQGTSYVPQDGLAYLHQGERVVNAEQNRMWVNGRPLPVGGGQRIVVQASPVNIVGARLAGTLDLGGGLEARIDARIVDAFDYAGTAAG